MTYEIDLSNANELMNVKALEMLKVSSRYLLNYGGAGSSKSYSTTQVLLIRMLKYSNHRILIARKYGTSLKKSVFQLFLDVINQWGLVHLFKMNLSNMTIICKNGSRLMFVGLDDVEKLKSIAGVTTVWIEESSEISLEDFTQLDLRLRGKSPDYLQIILTFNPISSLSWLKRRFFDNNDSDTYFIHSTFLDNRFIDKHYKNILENLMTIDANAYRVYALGEWDALSGRIYESYELVNDLPGEYQFRRYGLDFGFNVPMALVELRIDGNNIYLQELYYQTHTTTDDLIQFIKDAEVSTRDPIYCDSAEPDRIETLKRAGFNAVAARKNVLSGIDVVKSKKIHITKASNNLIKEINTYSWKIDKDGKSMEEPVKFNDHLMDGMRYCTYVDDTISSKLITTSKRRSTFIGYTGGLNRKGY